MSDGRKIIGWWSYILEVVLKPWLGFWLASTVMLIVYTVTWLRDNVMPEDLQKKYDTRHLLPQWHWQTWLVVLLVGGMVSIVMNGYEVWEDMSKALVRPKHPETRYALELILEVVTSRDKFKPGEHDEFRYDFPIKVTNISQYATAYNVKIAALKTAEGEVKFSPSIVNVIKVGEYHLFKVRVSNAPFFSMHSIADFFRKHYKDKNLDELFEPMSFVIHLEANDSNSTEYLADFEVLYTPWKKKIEMGKVIRGMVIPH